MPLAVRTERALEACYDAVLAPTRWPHALQLLAESLGAASCTLHAHDSGEARQKVPMSSGHEHFDDLWVRNEQHAPDPHPKRCVLFAREGHASIVENQIVTDEERSVLPYYRETARPAKREWLATSLFQVEGRSWCLPVYRGGDRGPFSSQDARRLALLGPQLGKLVGLAETFAAFSEESSLSTLERARCAALVVDGCGRIKHSNLLAQKLLGGGFDLIRGRPAVGDPASNRRLQRLISAALVASPISPIVVDRDEAPWLLVEAMPITAFGSDLFSTGRSILLFTDLTSQPRPATMLLRIAFGLTASEARLAARLASGVGINGAATFLGVNRETARSQLKAIFAKTNTHRQAELVGLIARLRPLDGG